MKNKREPQNTKYAKRYIFLLIRRNSSNWPLTEKFGLSMLTTYKFVVTQRLTLHTAITTNQRTDDAVITHQGVVT